MPKSIFNYDTFLYILKGFPFTEPVKEKHEELLIISPIEGQKESVKYYAHIFGKNGYDIQVSYNNTDLSERIPSIRVSVYDNNTMNKVGKLNIFTYEDVKKARIFIKETLAR